MHGKIEFTLKGEKLPLWFNNFSKIELGKSLLPSVDGYPSKPEEGKLIKIIQKRVAENHLFLLCDIVHAGLIGHAYATNTGIRYSRAEVGGLIAEADEGELYGVWQTFLEAMGMNLDKIVSDSKKKAKKVS